MAFVKVPKNLDRLSLEREFGTAAVAFYFSPHRPAGARGKGLLQSTENDLPMGDCRPEYESGLLYIVPRLFEWTKAPELRRIVRRV